MFLLFVNSMCILSNMYTKFVSVADLRQGGGEGEGKPWRVRSLFPPQLVEVKDLFLKPACIIPQLAPKLSQMI